MPVLLQQHAEFRQSAMLLEGQVDRIVVCCKAGGEAQRVMRQGSAPLRSTHGYGVCNALPARAK